MRHVFISYNQEDTDFAELLETKLKEQSFRVWRDVAALHSGEDWRNEIDQAIQNSFSLIAVMTPAAKASEYVTYEWAFAWGAKVKVIPVLLKKTDLHPRLESLQYIDFTSRNSRPWDKLSAAL